MIVVGIDASLTSTGVAVTNTETRNTKTFTVKSSPASPETMTSRVARMDFMADSVFDMVIQEFGVPDAVAIEGPAYAKNTGKVWDRAGLWWTYLRKAMIYPDVKLLEVTPTTRCKYATGKGNAGKDEVLLATSRTYPDVEFSNNDEADALIVMAIMSRLLGEPIEGTLPQNKLDSLKIYKETEWAQ